MNTLYLSPFTFQSSRFEEWSAGRCISSGTINTKIVCSVTSNTINMKLLGDNQNLRILKEFYFNIDESSILYDGRIQYMKAPLSNTNPIIPIICHIYTNSNKISCVRFAMSFPDRLIEYYP